VYEIKAFIKMILRKYLLKAWVYLRIFVVAFSESDGIAGFAGNGTPALIAAAFTSKGLHMFV
jgi:hypothetical protein